MQFEFDSRRINLDTEILGATVACSVTFHNSITLLVCFYNPPETDGKPNADHISTDKVICTIEEVIEVSKSYRSKILYGDFNLKQVDWKDYSTKDSEEQQLLDIITQNDFQQIVDFPTAASGTLDLVFINSDTEVIQCKPTGTKLNFLINHTGIDLKLRIATLQEDYLRRRTQHCRILSYCNAGFDLMRQKIMEFPSSGICCSNINVLVELWYKWLNNIISECVQYRTSHRACLAPWIKPKTSSILKKRRTARGNRPSKNFKIPKLEDTCSTMIEDDKADFEKNVGLIRSTTNLFRYFRSFISTKSPLSVKYKDKTANDHRSQCSLYKNFSTKSSKNRLL